MDDLDELKGRVERATRVLSEREAEEQGRHAKLVALVAALESKSLEAREDKERAEARLAAVETENEELRALLGGLLAAVEAGSRSRFADALYALEARVGLSSGAGAGTPGDVEEGPAASAADLPEPHATDAEAAEGEVPEDETPENETPEDEMLEDEMLEDETQGTAAAEADRAQAPAEASEPDAASVLAGEDDDALDDFTARLAAGCAVEDELAREAEALRAEAADGAKALLARIRQQVEAPDPEVDSEVASEPGSGAEPDAEADEAAVLEVADVEAEAVSAEADEPEAAPETPDEAVEPSEENGAATVGIGEKVEDSRDEPLGEADAALPEGTTVEDAAPEDVETDGDGGWGGKRQAAS